MSWLDDAQADMKAKRFDQAACQALASREASPEVALTLAVLAVATQLQALVAVQQGLKP